MMEIPNEHQPWLYFDNFFFLLKLILWYIYHSDTNRFGTRRFMLESLLNKRASDKHDNLISFQFSSCCCCLFHADAVCSIIIFSSHLMKEFRLKLLEEEIPAKEFFFLGVATIQIFVLIEKFITVMRLYTCNSLHYFISKLVTFYNVFLSWEFSSYFWV